MGSITSWTRLEPRCRDDDMDESLRARIADPLWLLARQWQTGEFQAEDTGSPVLARWRGTSTPITRFLAGDGVQSAASSVRYDANAIPLEVLVERRPLSEIDDAPKGGSLRLVVETGLHFLRALDAQTTSRNYRGDFIRLFALQPPTDTERAGVDPESLSYWNLMANRVPDARRLLAAFRTPAGNRRALPAALEIAPGDRAEIERVVDDWVALQRSLVSQPQAPQDAWNHERLEYAFSISGAFGQTETVLSASQYSEGHLDWHSVDLNSHLSLGAAADDAATNVVRAVIPAPVSFRGAPAQRFWECEDASLDYGLMPAGPGDLPHLLLSEFATSFGNDWYVVPIELAVGTLTQTRSLVVTDSFGVQTLLKPINEPEKPHTGWSMFELSHLASSTDAPRPAASNLLFLAPSLLKNLEGRPLEEVLFMRDEMANTAWAIEHVIQGAIEQPIQTAAVFDPPQSDDTPAAALSYRLATAVPPNWTPLLPQRAADGSLRLVRAALLATDGDNPLRRAQGELLNAMPRLAIFDEEIPREGTRVTRHFELTRWVGGETLLWIGLRKQVGRGEGSSALRFDSVGD